MRFRYQGVLQIVRFNWPKYLGAVTLSLALLAAPLPWNVLSLPILFWTALSLVVSHYVYDRSPLYGFAWLTACLPQRPHRWLSLHAGLDESSPSLAALLPGSERCVLDIYDPSEMTEPSIKRARGATAMRMADWRNLPLRADSFDAAFLLFTAHELRTETSRAEFFRELARVIRPGGDILLVEHLRDAANYFAFGPGALHFFSRGSWLQASAAAGLSLERDQRLTPFVHALVFRKAAV